jgi:glutamate carboxypeptidase
MKNRFNEDNIDVAAMLAELRHWVELETPTSDAPRVNRLVDRVAALRKVSGLSSNGLRAARDLAMR